MKTKTGFSKPCFHPFSMTFPLSFAFSFSLAFPFSLTFPFSLAFPFPFTFQFSLRHSLFSSFPYFSFTKVLSSKLQPKLFIYLMLMLQPVVVGAFSAKVTEVRVPDPGIVGESAKLECFWEKGNRDIYSVRWYMNNEQFYSYIFGKEQDKVDHNLAGVNVELANSNDRVVTLRKLTPQSGGVYKCEVLTEAPFFQAAFSSANLTVVELPELPEIYGVRDRNRVGDTLNVTCTARNARPAAILVFQVNGKTVHPNSGRTREIGHAPGSRRGVFTTTSELTLPLSSRHEPSLTLTCEAHVLSVKVQSSVEIQVDPAKSTFISFFNTGGVPRSTSISHMILTAVLMLLLFCYKW